MIRGLRAVRPSFIPLHCDATRRIETAAKPETAIDKGLAGPGLLSYIVTSKFNDYLPCYIDPQLYLTQLLVNLPSLRIPWRAQDHSVPLLPMSGACAKNQP